MNIWHKGKAQRTVGNSKTNDVHFETPEVENDNNNNLTFDETIEWGWSMRCKAFICI